MDVEDYMLEGICDGCDQDPAMCYNLGYCYYDHLQEQWKKTTKEHKDNDKKKTT